MEPHVESAIFLYVPETKSLIQPVAENKFDSQITAVALQEFLQEPELHLQDIDHVVVSAPLDNIKSVLVLAMEHDFSIGIITTPVQRDLRECYGLPVQIDAAIEIALQKDSQIMDVILCNNNILLFKAIIGRLPLLDSPRNLKLWQEAAIALRRCIDMTPLPFQFSIASGRKIKTAASGVMIIQHHRRTLASRIISHDDSLIDGMISMVITAPISIIGYFKFLFQTFGRRGQRKRIPSSVGYIKSSKINIETETVFDVFIDGKKKTQTPLVCETVPLAVRVNVGEKVRESIKKTTSAQERIAVQQLPTDKELVKASNKRIPFFSYASEERFRDLFISLREDARVTPNYLGLMVLSTMLAAVGLYMSSSAVVIGAMILAPLMSPIVALAMGMLRNDTKLSKTAMMTIAVGIFIALSSAGLISLLFPHKPLTPEMQARLNPSLLDLAVGIIAGMAGAYTKSHKEILQSLAGVSIAVALVPPLAVAGIGLGMGDLAFFGKAFLLFFTNLIGITLAATFTFRILGFSAAVRNKRGIGLVMALMVAITIPLYFSYNSLVETAILEKSWQRERFLVNDKYLIVQKAELVHEKSKKVLFVKVQVREPLTRNDLNQLKKKLQSNFVSTLNIRVQFIYIP